jgi:hypothetical protein
LIRADSNELLFDVDQYGHHSDDRSDEERGDDPLTVIKKKQSNKLTWTILQQGISKEECREILDGFQQTGHHGRKGLIPSFYNHKSPQYPDYGIKK